MNFKILFFCLILMPIEMAVAENLADKISRYSESDELVAKQAMDKSCTESEIADNQFSKLVKKVNAALDQDLQAKTPLSSNSEAALQELEKFDSNKLKNIQYECTTAKSDYGRILKVREHAAIEAEGIEKRQMERSSNNREPKTTVNCTSNVIGQTIYTDCR